MDELIDWLIDWLNCKKFQLEIENENDASCLSVLVDLQLYKRFILNIPKFKLHKIDKNGVTPLGDIYPTVKAWFLFSTSSFIGCNDEIAFLFCPFSFFVLVYGEIGW